MVKGLFGVYCISTLTVYMYVYIQNVFLNSYVMNRHIKDNILNTFFHNILSCTTLY